jgi:hypothetical protein
LSYQSTILSRFGESYIRVIEYWQIVSANILCKNSFCRIYLLFDVDNGGLVVVEFEGILMH